MISVLSSSEEWDLKLEVFLLLQIDKSHFLVISLGCVVVDDLKWLRRNFSNNFQNSIRSNYILHSYNLEHFQQKNTNWTIVVEGTKTTLLCVCFLWKFLWLSSISFLEVYFAFFDFLDFFSTNSSTVTSFFDFFTSSPGSSNATFSSTTLFFFFLFSTITSLSPPSTVFSCSAIGIFFDFLIFTAVRLLSSMSSDVLPVSSSTSLWTTAETIEWPDGGITTEKIR